MPEFLDKRIGNMQRPIHSVHITASSSANLELDFRRSNTLEPGLCVCKDPVNCVLGCCKAV
jgi:hypothetical protein